MARGAHGKVRAAELPRGQPAPRRKAPPPVIMISEDPIGQ